MDMMRLRRIFSSPQYGEEQGMPMQPEDNTFAMNMQPSIDPNDLGQSVFQPGSEDFQPETAMQDRLSGLLQNIPQRQKTGMLRKLAGMFVGATVDPSAGKAVIDAPYNQAMEEFRNQYDPTLRAAGLERQSNIANQTRFNQERTADLTSRRLDETERNNRANTEIRQKRAEAYDFRTRHPNWKPVVTKGGTIKFVNPTNPNEVVDTGIDPGTLDDAARLDLLQENAMEQIGARGRESRETEDVRQRGRESIAETRGWTIANVPDGKGGQKGVKINQITGEVKDLEVGGPVSKTSTRGDGELLPTQNRVKEFTRAREALNTHPEWQKYIKLGDPGASDFTISPPSNAWYKSGPDQATYDAISQYIYGKNGQVPDVNKEKVVAPARLGGPGPTQGGAAQPVKMRAPDGSIKLIPADKVAEAEKRGAKRL